MINIHEEVYNVAKYTYMTQQIQSRERDLDSHEIFQEYCQFSMMLYSIIRNIPLFLPYDLRRWTMWQAIIEGPDKSIIAEAMSREQAIEFTVEETEGVLSSEPGPVDLKVQILAIAGLPDGLIGAVQMKASIVEDVRQPIKLDNRTLIFKYSVATRSGLWDWAEQQ